LASVKASPRERMHGGHGGPTTYRGTSIIRNCHPLGPYNRPMHRAYTCTVVLGVGQSLMGEVTIKVSSLVWLPACFSQYVQLSAAERFGTKLASQVRNLDLALAIFR